MGIWVVEAMGEQGEWVPQCDFDVTRAEARKLAERFRKSYPHLKRKEVRIRRYIPAERGE